MYDTRRRQYDIRSKNPSEYLINAIMEALDVYDRMMISMKLARGRATKAQHGDKPAGVCPYGYQYSKDKKSVVINPEEEFHAISHSLKFSKHRLSHCNLRSFHSENHFAVPVQKTDCRLKN